MTFFKSNANSWSSNNYAMILYYMKVKLHNYRIDLQLWSEILTVAFLASLLTVAIEPTVERWTSNDSVFSTMESIRGAANEIVCLSPDLEPIGKVTSLDEAT